jgi:hypothetical protein
MIFEMTGVSEVSSGTDEKNLKFAVENRHLVL